MATSRMIRKLSMPLSILAAAVLAFGTATRANASLSFEPSTDPNNLAPTSVDTGNPSLNISLQPVQSVSVPEPASVLGLFAFGAMGAGSMIKRKQQKKATVKA